MDSLLTGIKLGTRQRCQWAWVVVEFIAPVRDEQNKKLESLEVKV